MTQQRKRLGLAVPEHLHEKISEMATYHGKTINSTCLDIFWEYFEDGETKHEESDMQKERPNPANTMGVGKEE